MSDNNENAIAASMKVAKTRLVMEISEWAKRIENFLNATPDARGKATVSDLLIPKESGGSSGTILFTASFANGESQRLVLRFHSDNTHANYCDIPAQYHVLRALHGTDVPSPRVVGELDATGMYLSVPGFLMTCMEGTSLPPTYPLNGDLFDATPAQREQIIREAIAGLVKLHRVDWRAKDIERHTRKGEGSTPVESDINWYWKALNWGMPDFAARIAPARQWLLDNQFEPKQWVLCHGDSSLHNYMFKDHRLTGMLDWEFAFIGTPEVDLAFQIAASEFLEFGNPPLPGLPGVEGRTAIFAGMIGRPLDHWDYWFMIGQYKMYIHMALSFRGAPASLDAARDGYLDYAFGRINDCWEKAKA